ncbi:hypothetical protein ACRRTK_020931 [Alexandromys fortis]
MPGCSKMSAVRWKKLAPNGDDSRLGGLPGGATSPATRNPDWQRLGTAWRCTDQEPQVADAGSRAHDSGSVRLRVRGGCWWVPELGKIGAALKPDTSALAVAVPPAGYCKAQFEVIKQEKRFSDSTLPTRRAIFHSFQRQPQKKEEHKQFSDVLIPECTKGICTAHFVETISSHQSVPLQVLDFHHLEYDDRHLIPNTISSIWGC